MITPAFTQFLVSTVSASKQMHQRNAEVELGRMQLRALESQLDHHREMTGMQLSLARDLIHALIEKRIEATQAGFMAVIAIYAEQDRHYMAQQEKLVEAHFRVTDALENANHRARLAEIDRQLSRIRTDARLLYQEMNSMLSLIGRAMPVMLI